MSHKPKAAEALGKIELAFSAKIRGGHWTTAQADFWAEIVREWPEDVTVDICAKVISQYDSPPSVAEMLRLKREYVAERDKPQGASVTFEDIADKPGVPWWFAMTGRMMRSKVPLVEIHKALLAEDDKRADKMPMEVRRRCLTSR